MDTGLIGVIIILATIALSIKTKKSIEFMILGSMAGAAVLYGWDFLNQWLLVLQDVMTNIDYVWLIIVCALFGSLIALLQASRGSYGFSRIVAKMCNTERKTLLTSFVLGIIIFIDDYLNILSIGVCMKNVYDGRKIPRETLAYMLDSTGAPVCVLLPFSTWAIFLASVFTSEECVQALGFSSDMDAYVAAIPFALYPIIALTIVFLFVLGIMPKLGAMKKAYARVEETGKLFSDASRKYNHEAFDEADNSGSMWDFIIPMAVLVAIAATLGDLLLAVVASIGVCFVLYIPRKVVTFADFFNVVLKGMADMLPVLTLLIIAFILEHILAAMGMTDFIIQCAVPLLTGASFPAIVFVLVAFLTFTTGSFWGMCAVVSPIVLPLGGAVDANILLVMGAVISGGAFGSHACFYADATLLASQSSGIEPMEHSMSQMPYVIIASVLTIIGYIVLGIVL